LIGILDLEVDYGQLFWFLGEEIDYIPESKYILSVEIERELKRGY